MQCLFLVGVRLPRALWGSNCLPRLTQEGEVRGRDALLSLLHASFTPPPRQGDEPNTLIESRHIQKLMHSGRLFLCPARYSLSPFLLCFTSLLPIHVFSSLNLLSPVPFITYCHQSLSPALPFYKSDIFHHHMTKHEHTHTHGPMICKIHTPAVGGCG